MKKLVSLLVLAVLVAGMICIPASAETTTLTFWTHQNTAWNDSWRELIAAFEEANPDIKVEYETFPYSDFQAKTQTSLMSSEAGADVYEVWGGWLFDFASAGALQETPEDLIAELLEDAYTPVLGAAECNGKYYGAPLELNAEYGGMFVNKHLFEAAGLEYPTTWAELLDDARAMTVGDENGLEVRGLDVIGNNDSILFNWLAMILQNGGEILDENGHLIVDSEIAIKCMEELVSYDTVENLTDLEGLVNLAPFDLGDQQLLATDELAMLPRGSWILADLEESYGLTYGEDFDFIPIPPFVEGAEQKWAAETGWSLCVAADTQNNDAAWRFVRFAMEPENLLQHNIDCAQIPPRKSVANDPEFIAAVPYMEQIVGLLDGAEYVGKFDTDIVKGLMNKMVIALCSEDGTYASVEEGCKALQADLEANVKYY